MAAVAADMSIRARPADGRQRRWRDDYVGGTMDTCGDPSALLPHNLYSVRTIGISEKRGRRELPLLQNQVLAIGRRTQC